MAAVTILAIAIGLMLANLSRNIDTAAETNVLRVVEFYAAEKMEEKIMGRLLDNVAEPEDTGEFEENGPQWAFEEESINLTTEDEQQDGKESFYVDKVVLKVTYTSISGKQKTLQLATILPPPKEESQ